MIDKLASRSTQYSLGRNVCLSENEIDRLVRRHPARPVRVQLA
jgi:predicted oxidoreductase (fatty acid repression mutant protein)